MALRTLAGDGEARGVAEVHTLPAGYSKNARNHQRDLTMTQPVIEIDGTRFEDLAGFCEEVSAKLTPGHRWRGGLDAFNDILRGGFGTPEGGFILRWKNSEISRKVLGWPATLRWLDERVMNCHPDNVSYVQQQIEAARRNEGQTLFDVFVEIIRDHGPGGAESEDGVRLELM